MEDPEVRAALVLHGDRELDRAGRVHLQPVAIEGDGDNELFLRQEDPRFRLRPAGLHPVSGGANRRIRRRTR